MSDLLMHGLLPLLHLLGLILLSHSCALLDIQIEETPTGRELQKGR